MREKSEMKSALSAQMCRLESPSRTVESEPENVLNTVSPGRSSSWILPFEMMSKEIQSQFYSNKSKEWSTRTSYRLQQFQALPIAAVRIRQVQGVSMVNLCVQSHLRMIPSMARNSSTVTASGRVRFGRANPPCFGQPPPGSVPVPSRQLPPPPPPPQSNCSRSPTANAAVYPRQWTALGAQPKPPRGGPPDGSDWRQ